MKRDWILIVYYSLTIFLQSCLSQKSIKDGLSNFYDRSFYCFTVKTKTTIKSIGEGNEEKLVFRHHNREKVVDHVGGTRGYPKTIYFVKREYWNVVKVIPNLPTFHQLGLKEELDLTLEISEEDFQRDYIYQYSSIPCFQFTAKDRFDGIMDREIFKSKVLQGISLRNYTLIGNYINPSLLPFKNRLLMATGLAWFGSDNLPANELLEFRWLNHSLASFPIYSKESNPHPSSQDPNPNDTYYLGVNEQHVSRLGVKDIVGQDPRMVVISDYEFYLVYTNRFHNPITMGAALIYFNHTQKELQIRSSHGRIHHIQDRSSQKNWSPFVLVKNPDQQSSLTESHYLQDQLSSQGSPVEYYKDLYLIQQIHPLTVYRVAYEDMNNIELNEQELPFELISRDTRDLEINWKFGHIRGGTNAIYLSKYNCYLSFFHSSTYFVDAILKSYVFGAYTFTASAPFQLLAYTTYPIMTKELYSGPWNPLKNRQIDYIAFPMSCALFHNETELLLSLGHQDSRGWTVTTTVAEVMNNLVPVIIRSNQTNQRFRKY